MKTGDGDLALIKEPALLRRCAWSYRSIYGPALLWHEHDKSQQLWKHSKSGQWDSARVIVLRMHRSVRKITTFMVLSQPPMCFLLMKTLGTVFLPRHLMQQVLVVGSVLWNTSDMISQDLTAHVSHLHHMGSSPIIESGSDLALLACFWKWCLAPNTEEKTQYLIRFRADRQRIHYQGHATNMRWTAAHGQRDKGCMRCEWDMEWMGTDEWMKARRGRGFLDISNAGAGVTQQFVRHGQHLNINLRDSAQCSENTCKSTSAQLNCQWRGKSLMTLNMNIT